MVESNSKHIIYNIYDINRPNIINDKLPSAIIINYTQANYKNLHKIVKYWLSNGAVQFVVIGHNAKYVEEEIDWILIDECKMGVVTTEHSGDLICDALDFAILNMSLNYDAFRIVFATDKYNKLSNEMKLQIKKKELKQLSKGWNKKP